MLFLVAIVITITTLQSLAPTHDCMTQDLQSARDIRAVKVIARPWFGRHWVYGVFVIPMQYRNSRRYGGQLSVEYFTASFNPDGQQLTYALEGVSARADQYVVRAYMPTRAALGFLVSGRFGDLKLPCNWSIELFDRWAQLQGNDGSFRESTSQ